MGDALFLFNISRPRRLTELNKISQMASRTLAENSRRSGISDAREIKLSRETEVTMDPSDPDPLKRDVRLEDDLARY